MVSDINVFITFLSFLLVPLKSIQHEYGDEYAAKKVVSKGHKILFLCKLYFFNLLLHILLNAAKIGAYFSLFSRLI